MFKKTVVAAALTLGMVGTASAYTLLPNTGVTESNVAIQSTQTVLQFQTGNYTNIPELRLDADTEAPADSFVRLELTGGAKWNLAEVKKGALIQTTGTLAVDNTQASLLDGGTVLRVPVTIAGVKDDTFKVDAEIAGAFDLREAGNAVTITAGVQRLDGSFSANPKSIGKAFNLLNVVKVANVFEHVDTAQVSEQYKVFENDTSIIGTGSIEIENQTTNQGIIAGDVALTIHGDFSDVQNTTYPSVDGNTSSWTINAARTAATATLTSELQESTSVFISTPNFEFDGETPIKPQTFTTSFKVKNSPTFSEYEVSDSANFIVRDGFRFDTVTTGTTADNSIYIRDVSGNIPAEGGKVNVTIWEFDAEGNGTLLVEAKPLSMTLTSEGAMTLTPAQITADLGVEATPGMQARFLFEVETEVGEAAVRKFVPGTGIDIQTGGNNFALDATL
ncbi:hypothetical protein [Photobacterium rosenbergii]|uniref:VapA family S-layer protein n=1 Tax=Photobacterium rosenbergii TaxID=294936 RepID=UPI001C996EF7|nr:hypothetical protein [Photobacterium rosenbergii]MBY5947383.1 hypothetical protein [Photobacterium rosenbergii]